MSTLNKIVAELEVRKLKKTYLENKDIIDIVSDFIIKKELLLYGGLTINLLLPVRLRFYKDFTLNDYDCYSKNALKDVTQLAHLLKKKGYKYIKIRKALHKDTYRLYVKNVQVIDVSVMNKDIYDKLYQLSAVEMPHLKHYKDAYKLIPLIMVKRNLYFELARPERSGWRWEKVYKRLQLIQSVYKTEKSKMQQKCIPIDDVYKELVKNVLQFVKVNGLPIIDSYAMKFYMKMKNVCCCRLHEGSKFLVVLSNDYEKTKADIVKMINKTLDMNSFSIIIDDKSLYTDIMAARYGISILNKKTNVVFRLITIIKNENECLSIQKINGYTVGAVDTILYFLYSYYILNLMNAESVSMADENLYFINKYETYVRTVLKNNTRKRLKATCYGIIDTEKEIQVNWKKRRTLKYV